MICAVILLCLCLYVDTLVQSMLCIVIPLLVILNNRATPYYATPRLIIIRTYYLIKSIAFDLSFALIIICTDFTRNILQYYKTQAIFLCLSVTLPVHILGLNPGVLYSGDCHASSTHLRPKNMPEIFR